MNYNKTLNLQDLTIIFKETFSLIEEYYKYIIFKFKESKIHIKNHTNEILTLIFELNNEKKAEINLNNQELEKTKNCHLNNNILDISLLSDISSNSYNCFFNCSGNV